MSSSTVSSMNQKKRAFLLLANAALIISSLTYFVDAQEQQVRRRLKRLFDPKSVSKKSDAKKGVNRRKFVSYTSSQWEQLWLNHVDQWANRRQICDVLIHDQKEFVHDFLNLTCTSRYAPPHDAWCIIDDDYRPLFYNTRNRNNFELSWVPPFDSDAAVEQPSAVVPGPEHEHVVSKFVFLDELTGEEYVEYIEPLVSHLRFPLCKCVVPNPDTPTYKYYYTTFRGYVIPPPGVRNDKAVYFDAGASSWEDGSGGPSLKYFFDVWKRQGIEFDDIYAFEMKTTKKDFYDAIPRYYAGRTHYQQCAVTSSPDDHSNEHPFLPLFIKENSEPEDYVFFKLDIDSPSVEDGSILFLLEDPETAIDELAWEHHIRKCSQRWACIIRNKTRISRLY
mmetsp:Transcript_29004/g.41011  ORF Transcript_29004/g.41011 Transcript_29004/m.41011 type:complete len:391 (+) Transcript_29004:55-1227(+)